MSGAIVLAATPVTSLRDASGSAERRSTTLTPVRSVRAVLMTRPRTVRVSPSSGMSGASSSMTTRTEGVVGSAATAAGTPSRDAEATTSARLSARIGAFTRHPRRR